MNEINHTECTAKFYHKTGALKYLILPEDELLMLKEYDTLGSLINIIKLNDDFNINEVTVENMDSYINLWKIYSKYSHLFKNEKMSLC